MSAARPCPWPKPPMPNGSVRYDPFEQLWHALAWQHGADRALEIMCGADPATTADLAAWRSLGGEGGA